MGPLQNIPFVILNSAFGGVKNLASAIVYPESFEILLPSAGSGLRMTPGEGLSLIKGN